MEVSRLNECSVHGEDCMERSVVEGEMVAVLVFQRTWFRKGKEMEGLNGMIGA